MQISRWWIAVALGELGSSSTDSWRPEPSLLGLLYTVPTSLLSIFTLFCLLSSYVSSIYIFLFVLIRKCWGQRSCVSFTFCITRYTEWNLRFSLFIGSALFWLGSAIKLNIIIIFKYSFYSFCHLICLWAIDPKYKNNHKRPINMTKLWQDNRRATYQ